MMSSKLRIIFCFWILGLGAGLAALWNFAHTPGLPGKPQTHWPALSQMKHDTQKPTLVMLLHPHCSCSRAALSELHRLAARFPDAFHSMLIFTVPPNRSAEWAHAWLWDAAADVPAAERILDHNGREAALFGAATSGHVLLYDSAGLLLFSGGITPSRGHEGDSSGGQALRAILSGEKAEQKSSFIFGCPLTEPSGETA